MDIGKEIKRITVEPLPEPDYIVLPGDGGEEEILIENWPVPEYEEIDAHLRL